MGHRRDQRLAADSLGEGASIAAETIYLACYDHSGSGPARGALEARCRDRRRRRKPQGRLRALKSPSPLGFRVWRPIWSVPQPSSDLGSEPPAATREGDLIPVGS